MGTDIVTQCGLMPDITVAAIAEINPGAAAKALTIAGRAAGSHVEAGTQSAFDAALDGNKTAITTDAQLVCKSPHVDVVIDATGRPGVGASIGVVAMESALLHRLLLKNGIRLYSFLDQFAGLRSVKTLEFMCLPRNSQNQ